MKTLQEMKLRETKAHRLHQVDARVFKAKLHEVMKTVFSELDIDVTEIENALILEIANDELGAIPVEAKFVVKALDFDILSAEAQFKEKQAEAQAKAEAKAKAKAERE